MILNNIKDQKKLKTLYMLVNNFLLDLKNNFLLNVAHQLLLVSLRK